MKNERTDRKLVYRIRKGGHGILWALFFLGIACESDPTVIKRTIIVGEINKVLILGNSITITRPAPDIGWYGHWGMAATNEENDYVHLLAKRFQVYNDSIQIQYASVSNFEREFWKYDYSQLDAFCAFRPDLIIIRLGENVDEMEAFKRGFGNHLQEFISYLTDGRHVAVLCTSTFWPKNYVNLQLQSMTDRENYIYVPITDLFRDRTNTAAGRFADPQVEVHPSDKGMKNIADRISDKLDIF